MRMKFLYTKTKENLTKWQHRQKNKEKISKNTKKNHSHFPSLNLLNISITGPPGHFLPLLSHHFYIIRLLKTTHPIEFLESSN